MGMIFEETYAPFFRQGAVGFFDAAVGVCRVELVGAATRTGRRAEAYRADGGASVSFQSFTGESAVTDLLASGVDFLCVASPDDRHFDAARQAILAGTHVLIEKPSVLTLAELDEPFRGVVQLVDVEGLTYAEAAEVLGVPTGTVMSRLHRARGRIRDRLDRAGLAPRSH